MRRVDVVMIERLIHVLEDVKTVEQHWSVIVGHQVATETVNRHPLCDDKPTSTSAPDDLLFPILLLLYLFFFCFILICLLFLMTNFYFY